MDQKCITCHHYHTPTAFCQDIQEAKDKEHCCAEWYEIMTEDHQEGSINCDVCGFIMKKDEKHLRCIINLGGIIK